MKGDYSRLSFDRRKHYSAVLMQQGRVQLDADWNEQALIAHHRHAALFRDLVGRSGTPQGMEMRIELSNGGELKLPNRGGLKLPNGGELELPSGGELELPNRGELKLPSGGELKLPNVGELKPREELKPLTSGELLLTEGAYYIDGLVAENEKAQVLAPPSEGDGVYLYYLDMWTRCIGALEDEDLIDAAVGLETTRRLKTAWAIGHRRLGSAGGQYLPGKFAEAYLSGALVETCRAGAWPKEAGAWPKQAAGDWWRPLSAGQLGLQSLKVKVLDNRLYRIEVHRNTPDSTDAPDGTDSTDTPDSTDFFFKWATDNASLCAEVEVKGAPTASQTFTLKNQSLELKNAFRGAAWIELSAPGAEGSEASGKWLFDMSAAGNALHLDTGGFALTTPEGAPRQPMWPAGTKLQICRWDGIFEWGDENALEAELGVKLRYGPQEADPRVRPFCRDGDYWHLLLRGGEVVNWEEGALKGPEGTEHHHAALALVEITKGAVQHVEPLSVVFKPLWVRGQDVSIEGNLDIEGNLSVEGETRLAGTQVHGDLDVEGQLKATGETRLEGTTIGEYFNVLGCMTVEGETNLTDTYVTGDLDVDGHLTAAGATLGSTRINGGLNVDDVLTVDRRGLVLWERVPSDIPPVELDPIEKLPAKRRALVGVEGSMEIAENLSIRASLQAHAANIEGGLEVGEAVVAKELRTAEGADIGGDLRVGGSLSIERYSFELLEARAADIREDVRIGGNAHIGASLHVGKQLSAQHLEAYAGSFVAPADAMELLYFALSPQSLECGAGVDTQSLRLVCKGAWKASSDAKWCTLEPASGQGSTEVGIHVEANTGTGVRSATLSFTTTTPLNPPTALERTVVLTQPPLLAPRISGFIPSAAQHGSALTLLGSHFHPTPANNTVRLNGIDAEVEAATATQLTVSVPLNKACSGPLTVEVQGGPGVATSAVHFEYLETGRASVYAGLGTPGFADGLTRTVTKKGELMVALESGELESVPPEKEPRLVPGDASAQFNTPCGMAVGASGELYVGDFGNHSIRLITPSGLLVSTLLNGSTGAGFMEDGPEQPKTGGTLAPPRPWGIAVDAGVLYITDQANHCILRAVLENEQVTGGSVIGSRVRGFADGTKQQAMFNNPAGVAMDASGNLYIADSHNHCIRKVSPDMLISRVTPDGKVSRVTAGEFGQVVLNELVWVPSDKFNRVEPLDKYKQVTLEELGSLTAVERIRLTPEELSSVASGEYILVTPEELSKVTRDEYIRLTPDELSQVTAKERRKVTPDMLTLVTEQKLSQTTLDELSQLTPDELNKLKRYEPSQVTPDIVSQMTEKKLSQATLDELNKLTPDELNKLTLYEPIKETPDELNKLPLEEFNKLTVAEVSKLRPDVFSEAALEGVSKLPSEAFSQVMTRAGQVSTVAGGTQGYADGSGTEAQFNTPQGLAIDAEGNLYIADSGNHRIRKLTPEGAVSTLAGGTQGFADGRGSKARFNGPQGITLDAAGNLYIADTHNHRIRKLTPEGEVSTLAGSSAGFANGAGAHARFNVPIGMAIDEGGNLYAADAHNHRIRKVVLE